MLNKERRVSKRYAQTCTLRIDFTERGVLVTNGVEFSQVSEVQEKQD